jgi:peroxiredoxin
VRVVIIGGSGSHPLECLAMIQPLLLALCFGVAPPVADTPRDKFDRLYKEVFVLGGRLGPDVPKRFAEHARLYANDPSAIEALLQVIPLSPVDSDARRDALAKLEKHYARGPLVETLLPNLGLAEGVAAATFLRQIAETNPDRRIRALAWRAMLHGRTSQMRMHRAVAKIKNPEALWGPEGVARIRAAAVACEKDIEEARDMLKSPALLGAIPNVSLGAKAPATEAVDLDGKKATLADHRGKVIVLDFWHTTCAPCLKRIPPTNALVKEMKGRPFVHVGASVDPGRGTVRVFAKKTPMLGESWWVGPKGKALETWDVEGYPTVYVIDHEGIIRHRQAGFDPATDKLHEVVRALVAKAEAARAAK